MKNEHYDYLAITGLTKIIRHFKVKKVMTRQQFINLLGLSIVELSKKYGEQE